VATTMAMSLTITVEHLEPANAHVLVCLVCAGEISLQTLATVRQSVNSLIKSDNFVKGDQLILDLSDVNFIDTSGLGALLGIKDIWSDERGRLAVGGLSSGRFPSTPSGRGSRRPRSSAPSRRRPGALRGCESGRARTVRREPV